MVNKKYLLLDGAKAVKKHVQAQNISEDALLRYFYGLSVDDADLALIKMQEKINPLFRERLNELKYFTISNDLFTYQAYQDYLQRFLIHISPSLVAAKSDAAAVKTSPSEQETSSKLEKSEAKYTNLLVSSTLYSSKEI